MPPRPQDSGRLLVTGAVGRVAEQLLPGLADGYELGLCVPDPTAAAAAGWTGPADLQQIVIRALETDVRFGVYHAMSRPSRQRWSLDATVRSSATSPNARAAPLDDLAPDVGAAHLSTCTPDGEDGVPRN
jgi:hypothetical protein